MAPVTPSLNSPDQAEAAFYAAFEGADMDAMMGVWSEQNDIVCIHPNGPRLVGQTEVRVSWEQILKHSPPIHFRIDEINKIETDELAVHYVSENVHVGSEDKPRFTVLATNIYRRTQRGWRMILHHASPTPESVENVSRSESAGRPETEPTLH